MKTNGKLKKRHTRTEPRSCQTEEHQQTTPGEGNLDNENVGGDMLKTGLRRTLSKQTGGKNMLEAGMQEGMSQSLMGVRTYAQRD